MIKIGILKEHPLPQPMYTEWHQAIELVFEQAHENGLLSRPVELVIREADGLPNGKPYSVVQAWRELEAEGCIGIIGPNSTDNALALADYLGDDEGIPSIAMCGTEAWPGRWRFALPAGSMPLEPLILALYLKKAGASRVALIVDKSGIGEEYTRNFHRISAAHGLTTIHTEYLHETQVEHSQEVARLKQANPDALIYFGYGMSMLNLTEEMEAIGWSPLRVATTGFEFVNFGEKYLRSLRGWVGLDQLDEENALGQQFLDDFGARFGSRPNTFWPLMCRDMAQMMALAVADSIPSPTHLRDALERQKLIPAASGAPGTLMSFGKWQRTGWANSNYLVLRRVNDAGTGTLLESRFQDLQGD